MTTQDDITLLGEKSAREVSGGNFAAALEIYKILAAAGVQSAYTSIGYIYEIGGGGVERNLNYALDWYKKSVSEFNDSGAHLDLGRIYSMGNGIKQDYLKAHYHFEQAFFLNRPEAGILLGMMYLNGQGVQRDLSKARHYFEFSASLGYFFAKAKLIRIELKSTGFHLAAYLKGIELIWDGLKCIQHNPRDARLYGYTRLK